MEKQFTVFLAPLTPRGNGLGSKISLATNEAMETLFTLGSTNKDIYGS